MLQEVFFHNKSLNILAFIQLEIYVNVLSLNFNIDSLDETIVGDPETDKALAEFDFLADETKPEVSENDTQTKRTSATVGLSTSPGMTTSCYKKKNTDIDMA